MRIMTSTLKRAVLTAGTLLLTVALLTPLATSQTATIQAVAGSNAERQIDRVFDRWTSKSPGCAVAVSVDGKPILSKAYGMADLEHEVPNTPDTIFEAGSVSKQFTAAAVLLLARDGKLSLDDPARKYVPELPDYGSPLTIRHMLNHTSGLRDWGSVAGVAGWPRTTRVYTHAHVLDIVSRQRSLNFTPGTKWSYSNTGYNLAAIIVSRVSGMSFADFTRERIFEPLGMTRTSWRDDYGRIVKNRAMSYTGEDSGYRTLMPFENVHGNGGLLTTVGDLLKWNQNFVAHTVGDQAFAAEQEQAGRFNDSRAHGYALGLQVGTYKGLREISHGGATAGYRAYLSRYPEAKTAIALLCNAASVVPETYANAVAEIVLSGRMIEASQTSAVQPVPNTLATLSGAYRNVETGMPMTLTSTDTGLRMGRAPSFVATTGGRLASAGGDVLETDAGGVRVVDSYGSVTRYERVSTEAPSDSQLKSLVGSYRSDEAEVDLEIAVVDGNLVIKRRPNVMIALTPAYPDVFSGSIGVIRFHRAGDRVTGFSVVQDRVWDLRFTKQTGS
jgi:CubicO group peptidase (beta-lactamase class C family)